MTQAVKNVKPRKKSVRRIKTDDGRYVVALVDEDGLVIAANEFISAKDTQSVCNMVWAVLVRCCGEEPPEDSNITNSTRFWARTRRPLCLRWQTFARTIRNFRTVTGAA